MSSLTTYENTENVRKHVFKIIIDFDTFYDELFNFYST